MAAIKRVLVAGGGGWKGAYQRRILQHLWQTHRYDAVLGTSVGALNLALVVQHKFDVLDYLWDSFDTKNPAFGVKGFLRPVWPKALLPFVGNPEGLFSIDPLLPLLQKHVHLRDFTCVYGAGVVTRDNGVHTNGLFPVGAPADENVYLHKVILASSAMCGIMEPVIIGGHKHVDGGHRHVVNPLPPEWKYVEDVDVVFCQALDTPVHVGKAEGAIANLLWGISSAFHVTALEDLEDYRELARAGVRVRVWYPRTPLGDMLDASAEAIRARTAQGMQDIHNPVIL